jgi:hypothetical protein
MTIKLKVAAAGAKAKITEVSLPSELEAGKWITGYVVVANVGDARGLIRLYLTTLWDGMRYRGEATLDPNKAAQFNIPEGLIKMPERDAEIKLEACHDDTVDDTRTHVIKLKGAAPPAAKGQIVEVKFPEAAKPGETVEGSFKVKNVGKTEARFKGTVDDLAAEEKTLAPGETLTVSVKFRMGYRDVTLTLKALRWDGEDWVVDDEKKVHILLSVPIVPVVVGTVIVGALVGAAALRRGK